MDADRPTLLVADDYPENLKLFTLYLRKTYTVVTAISAEGQARAMSFPIILESMTM